MARLRRACNVRKRKALTAISIVLTLLVAYLSLLIRLLALLHLKKLERKAKNTPLDSIFDRQHDRRRYMRRTLELSDTRCIDKLRMSRSLFRRLCEQLVTEGRLKCTDDVAIDEMVMIFLLTIAHNIKNRTLQLDFCRSGQTISKVFHKVLRSVLRLHPILLGSYYLCDAGYSNSEGFLTPFRGQRYHLKEWGGIRPDKPEEYFNMKHAGARNCIERAFGILKMRWAILRERSWFSPAVMNQIVNACCLLHNFIKKEQGIDTFERDYKDKEPEHIPSTVVEQISVVQPSQEWTLFRDMKALDMWENRFDR